MVVLGVEGPVGLDAPRLPRCVAGDALRASQVGSFVLDGLWLLSGVVLWLPVCGALGELRPGYPVRAVLLFVGAGVVPMIPGGFLTFSDHPLYGVYELAPRVGGFDATIDQQLAGVLMKIGNLPLLWPVIGLLFARWARQSASATPAAPAARSPSL